MTMEKEKEKEKDFIWWFGLFAIGYIFMDIMNMIITIING